MRHTKAHLIAAMAADARNQDMTQTQLLETVNSIIDALKGMLTEPDHEVVLVGLGRFRCVAVPAAKRRNPRTGEVIEVPAKQAIRFKASKAA